MSPLGVMIYFNFSSDSLSYVTQGKREHLSAGRPLNMRIPQEIYDEIIGLTDFLTAVKAHNSRASARFYDENIHTWEWAAEGGHLDALKWLQNHRVDIRRSGNDIFEPHAEYNVLHAAWHAGNEAVVDWLLKNRPEMQIACQKSVSLMETIGATYSASPLTARFGWLQGVKWPIGSECNQEDLRLSLQLHSDTP